MPMEMERPRKDYQVAYTIVEGRDGREHWLKIGAAFRNSDGSLSVLLDAVPTNGKLHIREPRAFDERRRSAFSDDVPRELLGS